MSTKRRCGSPADCEIAQIIKSCQRCIVAMSVPSLIPADSGLTNAICGVNGHCIDNICRRADNFRQRNAPRVCRAAKNVTCNIRPTSTANMAVVNKAITYSRRALSIIAKPINLSCTASLPASMSFLDNTGETAKASAATRFVAFVYQPVRDQHGAVYGIFVRVRTSLRALERGEMSASAGSNPEFTGSP